MPPGRAWRQRLLELYGVLAVVVTGALVVERHRSSWSASSGEWGPWHNLAVEALLVPLLLALAVVPACAWGRRRAPRGLLAAGVGIVAGLVTLVAGLLVHLLSDVEGNTAAGVVVIGSLGLVAGALVLFVVEPLAAHRAREGRGPALRDVTLTGARRAAHAVAVAAVGGLAALLVVLLIVERHVERTIDGVGPDRREWFVADTYGLALVAALAIVVAAARARRGFPHGVVAGVLGFAAAVALAIVWGVLHTFTDDSTATSGALLVLAGLIVVGPVLAVLDGALHVQERRRVDQAGPTLPRARVAR